MNKLRSSKGLTFIEVMVTLVIFSIGIVSIYQVYFLSFDRIRLLQNRLYANTFLDNDISAIERMLRTYQVLPLEPTANRQVDVGSHKVDFQQQLKISTVDDFIDLFQVDMSFQWEQGDRSYSLSRSAYISEIEFLKDE